MSRRHRTRGAIHVPGGSSGGIFLKPGGGLTTGTVASTGFHDGRWPRRSTRWKCRCRNLRVCGRALPKEGCARMSAMQHSLRGALSQRHQFHGRQHLVFRPRPRIGLQSTPRARFPSARMRTRMRVACDTPSRVFAALSGKSSVVSSSSTSTRSNAAAQVPILGAQFFGFTAGDEERIPAQDTCRVILPPGGPQALQHRQIERCQACAGDAVYPLEAPTPHP